MKSNGRKRSRGGMNRCASPRYATISSAAKWIARKKGGHGGRNSPATLYTQDRAILSCGVLIVVRINYLERSPHCTALSRQGKRSLQKHLKVWSSPTSDRIPSRRGRESSVTQIHLVVSLQDVCPNLLQLIKPGIDESKRPLASLIPRIIQQRDHCCEGRCGWCAS